MDLQQINDLFTKFGQDGVAEMQKNLKRKITRTDAQGNRYATDTIATKKLFNSLRYEVHEDLFGIEMNIYGTKYWRNADGGTPAGTPTSPQAITAWLTGKQQNSGYPFQVLNPTVFAIRVASRIKKSGTLAPPSRFASDAIDNLNKEVLAANIPEKIGLSLTAEGRKLADLSNKIVKILNVSI